MLVHPLMPNVICDKFINQHGCVGIGGTRRRNALLARVLNVGNAGL